MTEGDFTFSARGFGALPGDLAILIANLADNHFPPEGKKFEKWHILLIKEELFVIRIE